MKSRPDRRSAAELRVSEHAPVDRGEAFGFARRVAPTAERYLKVTGSLCPACVADGEGVPTTIPMVVYEEAGEIGLAKECPDHGVVRDVYWRDAELYYRAERWRDEGDYLASAHAAVDPEAVDCPTSCGLCPLHRSHTGLGNVTVTNRCDLSCWYCFFYAREDEPLYEPTVEEIREMVEAVADEEPIGCNAIQLTGGEPTVRDDIVAVVEAVSEVVDHVQLNTHSGRLAGDLDLAERLREAGVNTIYTSFDGFDPEFNVKNYWEMPAAIRTYREADLPVVLVPTVIGGENVDQLGDIVRFAAANGDVVRGVNLQPVSFVGRMPDHERARQRVTIPDVIRAIERGTDGAVPAASWYPIPSVTAVSDFVEAWSGEPSYRLSNHFACGMATYVYVDGDDLVPITDFLEVDAFLAALDDLASHYDGDLGRLDRARAAARLAWELHRTVDADAAPDGARVGRWLLEALTAGSYEGLVEFHRNSLFLGTMHFMDPYNYDVDRVERCDIHYSMPDGRVAPFCAYNVLPGLYRDPAQARHAVSAEEWLERDYAETTTADRPDRVRLRSDDGDDGPGIYGYDVKRRHDVDEDERRRVERAYERSIERLEPV